MFITKTEADKERRKLFPAVNIRDGYSDRNKIKEQSVKIQLDELNKRTRVSIFNEIKTVCEFADDNKYLTHSNNLLTKLINRILANVFTEEINYNIENYNLEWFYNRYLRPVFMNGFINDVLDLLEYIINNFQEIYLFENQEIEKIFNNVFEKEFVGYRFVDSLITPITDEVEIGAVEEAIEKNPYGKCKKLIKEALEELSDREKPNYSLSIQRSITAVEMVCQIITGEQTTLGKVLKKLEDKGLIINGALKEAFNKMYGWTTDENDVRHANAFKDTVATFEDAKFMLVACSAFVNYLIGEYAKLNQGGANGES